MKIIHTKKRRNYVVPWLLCSIVVVISILYLFSPEDIISGQLEVTTRTLLTINNSRKRQVAIKPKVTRKIRSYRTVEQSKILNKNNEAVEPSKISKNKTVESSKLSNNKTVEPSKISKNKKVKPSDDSEYQSEYTHIAALQSKYIHISKCFLLSHNSQFESDLHFSLPMFENELSAQFYQPICGANQKALIVPFISYY